ncbi:MAG: hypothetical protein R3D68_06605 [Hyphomicrobiaceae bacterium]
MSEDTPIPGPLNNVIRIDDERIKGHLDRVVRGTVEETLNWYCPVSFALSILAERRSTRAQAVVLLV